MWCKFGRVPNLEGTKPSLARTSCFGGLAIRKAVNVTKCIVPEILVEIYFLENPKAGSRKGVNNYRKRFKILLHHVKCFEKWSSNVLRFQMIILEF